MWHALAQLLPIALAAAISVVPIMATILILVSDKRDQSAVPYAGGWVLGAAIFVTLAAVAAAFLPEGRPRHRETAVAAGEVLIGLALVVLGVVALVRRRSAGGLQPPGWMSRVDSLDALPALGLGLALNVRPKALLLAGAAALLLQGSVASAVLGESGGASLPSGLTVTMLLALVVYGVLGFLLYAVLYAAAGSLVSRQEDVNAAVMPMTLVSMAGYLVAVYAATGVFDPNSAWFNVLSQVPFVSPFLMISRIVAGDVSVPEVLLSIAILVVTIGGALWVAARIYAAGVLLYGQRPGLRATWRLVRSGS